MCLFLSSASRITKTCKRILPKFLKGSNISLIAMNRSILVMVRIREFFLKEAFYHCGCRVYKRDEWFTAVPVPNSIRARMDVTAG